MQSLLPAKERLLLRLSSQKQQVSENRRNAAVQGSNLPLGVSRGRSMPQRRVCQPGSAVEEHHRASAQLLTCLQVLWFHHEAPGRPQVRLPRLCVGRFHQAGCRVGRVRSRTSEALCLFLSEISVCGRGLSVCVCVCFCFPAKPSSCIIKSLWRLRVRRRTSTWSSAPARLPPQPCTAHCIIASRCMEDRHVSKTVT